MKTNIASKRTRLQALGAVIIPAVTVCQVTLTVMADPLSTIDDYQLSETKPHSRIWRNGAGQTVTEMASGMNYWDGQTWTPSDPSFQASADGSGFVADKIQFPTRLAADLNCAGAVSVTTPDNVKLSSTPLAIGLYDAASGQSVIVATLTNATGVLVDPQHVVYDNAFVGGGITASVVYSLPDAGSFSQDIVFTGFDHKFDPTKWGFAASSTNTLRVQIFTEFYDAPQPQWLMRPLYVERKAAKRAAMASPDLMDYSLDFGHYVFGPGRAYTTKSMASATGGVTVSKDFVTISGRTFLVESIPYRRLVHDLKKLPTVAKADSRRRYPHASKKLAIASVPSLGKVKPVAARTRVPGRAASLKTVEPQGVAVDYLVTIGSLTEPVLFSSDTTYFVSGNVYESSPVTMESAVFKYPTYSGSIQIANTLTLTTTNYRPAIFTAADDNTAGAALSKAIWSGYTGNPANKYYGSIALWLTTAANVALNNLRFNYEYCAIEINADASGQSLSLSHSELVDCVLGIVINGGNGSGSGSACGGGPWTFSGGGGGSGSGSTIASLTLNANNCLMSDVGYTFDVMAIIITGNVCNCTFDSCNPIIDADYYSSGSFTFANSVFSSSYYGWLTYLCLNGAYNGFYNSPSFGSPSTTVTNNPFQRVGAGNYYLSPSTPFLTNATTNSSYISPSLLAQLRVKTTEAPVILNETFTSDTALGPAIQRDTTGKALGFHYDPIDYISACAVSNSSLILTNGVSVAYYDNLGIWLQDGGKLYSQGTPNARNYLTYYGQVQEEPLSLWVTNGLAQSQPIAPLPYVAANKPSAFLWLTSIFAPTGETNLFNTSDTGQVVSGLTLRDCEVYGSGAAWQMNESSGTPSIRLTNNVFHRVPFAVDSEGTLTLFNNLFYGSTNAPGSVTNTTISISHRSGTSPNTNENNVFDGVKVALDGTVGYNGYIHGATNSTYQSSDIRTNLTWQTGPLGVYYQLAASPFIKKGSTSASNLDLYHYTVSVTNALEGTNTVSLGYHYVALGTNGLPLTNSSGVPDYILDTPVLPVSWIQPEFQFAATGSSTSFSVTVGLGTPPFTYQWQHNGVNITGATSSSYSLSSVTMANVGDYTVVVSNAAGAAVSQPASLAVSSGVFFTDSSGFVTSPAMDSNGTVYIQSQSGNLYAISSGGTANWTASVSGVDNAGGSPTVVSNVVYVGSGTTLAAFDATSGSPLLSWSSPTLTGNYVDAMPAVGADGTVYIGTESPGAFALNPSTGSTIWNNWVPANGMFASPAIGPDCTVYFVDNYSDLYAFTPENSVWNMKWLFPLPKGSGTIQASPAIGPDGTIYVGYGNGYLHAVTPAGTLKWVFDTGDGATIGSSPVVDAEGTVYFATESGNLYAVTNGAQKWVFNLSSSGHFYASPCLGADGTVYIGADDYNLYAVNSYTGQFEWSYPTSGPIYSSAVIGPAATSPYNVLYFASEDGNVYSILLAANAGLATNAPWAMFHKDPLHRGSASLSSCPSEGEQPPFLFDGQLSGQPGYGYSFDVDGPNATWEVYASSDLTYWGAQGTITISSSPANFTDSYVSGLTNRFYTVRTNSTSSDCGTPSGLCGVENGFVQVGIVPGANFIAWPFFQVNDGNYPQNTLNSLSQYLSATGLTIPNGMKIEVWNGSQLVTNTWSSSTSTWSPNGDSLLLPGQGAVLVTTSAFTYSAAGLVPEGVVTNLIQAGTNYVSSILPLAGRLQHDLSYNPHTNDVVRVLNSSNQTYTVSTYNGSTWSPAEPVLHFGQGFILIASTTNTWLQTNTPCSGYFGDQPTANDLSFTICPNTSQFVDLTSQVYDPCGLSLTYVLTSLPTHGSLVTNAAGQYTYTPNTNFCGTDGFVFEVYDGVLYSTQTTVLFTVGDVPTASGTTGNFTCPQFQLSLGGYDSLGCQLTVTITHLPAHGTVGPTNGLAPLTVTYTNATNFLSGSDSLTYVVSDGSLTSAPVVVPITVNITPPTAGGETLTTCPQTPINNLDITGLTYDYCGLPLTYIIKSGPTNGTLTTTGTGQYTYTPNSTWQGPDGFTYQVYDGLAYSTIATVIIDVTDTAPTATGQTLTTCPETPINNIDLTSLISANPCGLPLTYIIESGPTNGTLTVTGAGQYTYTPNPGWGGPDGFAYKVYDGFDYSAIATVIIQVGDVPTTGNVSGTYSCPDAGLTLTLNGSDTMGCALIADVVSGPTHGTVSPTSGPVPLTVSYAPNPGFGSGSDSFTFVIRDGDLTTPGTASITVSVPTPLATNQSVSGCPNTILDISLLAGDSCTDPLTASIVTPPLHGVLLPGTSSMIGYYPTNNYIGTDSFTYKASNGILTSSPATVSITIDSGPIISLQPTDVVICSNQTANFSVVVTNDTNVSYQWRLNGVNLSDSGEFSGSATSNLTVSPVGPSDDGMYDVIVTDNGDSCMEISQPASLNVYVILGQTMKQTVLTNTVANFSVTVPGSFASFQWQVSTNGGSSFSNILGATNYIYTTTPVTTLSNNDQFRVVLSSTNSDCEATSLPALLVVTNSMPPGTIKWIFSATPEFSQTVTTTVESSPALTNGYIYVQSADDGLDSSVDETGRLRSVNTNGTEQWARNLGYSNPEITSSPSIASNSTIYPASSDRLLAFSTAGARLWTYDVCPDFDSESGAFSSAIGTNGNVFIDVDDFNDGTFHGGDVGELYGIAPSQLPVWLPFSITGDSGSPPCVGPDGTVYFVTEGGTLTAMSNGAPVWTHSGISSSSGDDYPAPSIDSRGIIYDGPFAIQPPIPPSATPTILWTFSSSIVSSSCLGLTNAAATNGVVLFVDSSGNLFGADRGNGSELWEFQPASASSGSISTPAAASDGTVYYGSPDRNLYAVQVTNSIASPPLMLSTPLWKATTGGAVLSSPTIGPDGTVYVGSMDGNIYAVVGTAPVANTEWPVYRKNLRNTGGYTR